MAYDPTAAQLREDAGKLRRMGHEIPAGHLAVIYKINRRGPFPIPVFSTFSREDWEDMTPSEKLVTAAGSRNRTEDQGKQREPLP